MSVNCKEIDAGGIGELVNPFTMASTSKKTTSSPSCCDSSASATPLPIRRDAGTTSSLVQQDWTAPVPSAKPRPAVDSLPDPSRTASATKSM
ncbi:hypothetical protein OIU79_025594 [Salix purpurea]|uniref:Uncharacterized protein n=1 Tax=Salix purpurea TaxID=77065 RepID=A0A9Q0W853_SALPP|nr:hypothetical protein OIU79_025594 [Salix purpurea]